MKTRFDMLIRKIGCSLVFGVAGWLAWYSPSYGYAVIKPPGAITAQLEGVQHGTYGGRDYLTLTLGSRHEVGPMNCRSNLLRLDAGNDSDRRDQIEAIALSAMLSSDTVMIVLPTDGNQCLEGRPAFTDIYPVPVSF